MKKFFLILSFLSAASSVVAQSQRASESMDRIEICKRNYAALFGGEALTGEGSDPELMAILQKFIFGEVFETGDLDPRMREMITCVTLATLDTQPQLEAHAAAALNAGVTPLQLREAIYQCAPFIGFPRTLNAMQTVNRVFRGRGITLPLAAQGSVTEQTRGERGAAIQQPLYGSEIADAMRSLPDGMDRALPRFLTEVCFGDFYTRGVLSVADRELLSLCVLAALKAERQITAHAAGCLRAGHGRATLCAAMIQVLPYAGFPAALNAIRIIQTVEP